MKKKILLLTSFIIGMVLILANTSETKVKAEISCNAPKYNYYLFLDATSREYIYQLMGNSSTNDYSTSKDFELGIPENASIYEQGQVELTLNDNIANYDEKRWSTAYYHLTYTSIRKNNEEIKYDSDNAGNSYATSIEWRNDNGNQVEQTLVPDSYEEFKKGITSNLGNPRFNESVINIGTGSLSAKSSFGTGQNHGITRTWDKSKLEALNFDNLDNDIVWSPAVYYVSYCDNAPETYKVTVEYKEKDTEKTLANSETVENGLKTGDSYEYDCSSKKIDKYALYSEDEENYPTAFEGTIEDENVKLTCYYTSADTYDLTIEHLNEETNKKIEGVTDIFDRGYVTGDSYEHSCQKIDGYKLVDTEEHPSSFSGTFEDKNIKKQCYYKEDVYTLTINYGEEEDCITLLKEPESYDLKYKEQRTFSIPKKIGDNSDPTLGKFSDKFTTKPKLNGTDLNVTMPAKDVSICIVYTPKTGAGWIYLAWIIGAAALGYSTWYFVRYYKKQNNEI